MAACPTAAATTTVAVTFAIFLCANNETLDLHQFIASSVWRGFTIQKQQQQQALKAGAIENATQSNCTSLSKNSCNINNNNSNNTTTAITICIGLQRIFWHFFTTTTTSPIAFTKISGVYKNNKLYSTATGGKHTYLRILTYEERRRTEKARQSVRPPHKSIAIAIKPPDDTGQTTVLGKSFSILAVLLSTHRSHTHLSNVSTFRFIMLADSSSNEKLISLMPCCTFQPVELICPTFQLSARLIADLLFVICALSLPLGRYLLLEKS
ncbi:unnamed protein product [Ceratitis capitata]|uniref:(Mediterranean fruit fly) hypothetical protein n=1 Tax=Ceratitis capitata TaxID=7213 RepID=A0A811ULP6_CERCA|nr:unnamed protein product [Ceratitis capitata]